MKGKKKSKENKHLLHLTCQECGHRFTSERYRKYCIDQCRRAVSNRLAKTRYAEMRDIVLRSKGVIK